MDNLFELLDIVRLTGAVFLDMALEPECAYLTAPVRGLADILMPGAEHVVPYHLVTEGACRAALIDGEPVELATGDLVVFPGGDRHLIGTRSGDGLRQSPVEITGESLGSLIARDEVASIGTDGGTAAARIVCGYLACDARFAETYLSRLPRVLHVSLRDERTAAWVRSSVQYAVTCGQAAGRGAAVAVARLAELLFAEAIKDYLDNARDTAIGPIAALRDRHVGRALSLLHGEPGYAWTVRELAHRVGLSRSVLGQRFNALVGMPPIQYLTRWRTALAADRLRETDTSVIRVALEVGYESEAAFNRAFKRQYGLPPAAWRKRGIRPRHSLHGPPPCAQPE